MYGLQDGSVQSLPSVFETVSVSAENCREESIRTRQWPDCRVAKQRLSVIVASFYDYLVAAGITEWQQYVHQFWVFANV